MPQKTILHRDGTVTYWSVYHQVWERRRRSIPARELAAMSRTGRERVQAHLPPSYPVDFALQVTMRRPDLASDVAAVLTTDPTLTADEAIALLDEAAADYAVEVTR